MDIALREYHFPMQLHRAECRIAWRPYDCDRPEFYEARVTAYILASEIFTKVGHTAAAAHRRNAAGVLYAYRLNNRDESDRLASIIDLEAYSKLITLRHPDPKNISTLNVVDIALSIRGSWSKVPCPTSGRLHAGSRLGFSSFIWNGRSIPFHQLHTLTCLFS